MRRQFTGLSAAPKRRAEIISGRGAFPQGRSRRVTDGGPAGSENAGMSNERGAGNPSAVSPRVPGRGSSPQGQSGAKARQGCVADAQRVDIPVPPAGRLYDGVTEEGSRAGFWTSP